MFVTRLGSTGSTLSASTYLGGLSDEVGEAIAVDFSGYAYVTGDTDSIDFPTWNPYQASRGGYKDCFVTQLTTSVSSLYYSTYLGGAYNDSGKAIAVDDDYYTYVVGESLSSDFPTRNPYQASTGSSGYVDAFACKLTVSGTALVFSTYLGGNYGDVANGVDLGAGNNLYLAGTTYSSDFPVYSAYQATNSGQSDAFVTNLDSAGSTLSYSTYLGGSQDEEGWGISVDSDYGDACITGSTTSSDFPTVNAYQASRAVGIGGDAFLTNFGWEGNQLHWSTYLGGSSDDSGAAVAQDDDNNAYVAGYTISTDFPIRNAYQPSLIGDSSDGFISRFFWGPPAARNQYHTDFNGDGTSDIAIFRADTGLWAIRGITRIYFGSSLDRPVPADYNGDATTDIAVYRQSSGLWAIRTISRLYFGDSWDTVVPGDYNGDGCAAAAIFRPTSGLWAVRQLTRIYYGQNWDLPLPGYYDGDAVKDIALFRPSSNLWALRNISRIYFGSSGDELVPGDYSGLDYWVPSVFRPASGLWAARGVTRVYFGSSLDEPVPADYSGAGRDDFGVFRESSGLWAISAVSRVYFGGYGDIPVTR